MIINAAVQEILKGKPRDELIVANQEEYFNGTPQYSEVCDIVKENNKLIILTR